MCFIYYMYVHDWYHLVFILNLTKDFNLSIISCVLWAAFPLGTAMNFPSSYVGQHGGVYILTKLSYTLCITVYYTEIFIP